MIEISLILYSTFIILRDQNKLVFNLNNYIDWDQFNQLYDLDWIKKSLKKGDIVTHKLRPALTRAINEKLKIAKKES